MPPPAERRTVFPRSARWRFVWAAVAVYGLLSLCALCLSLTPAAAADSPAVAAATKGAPAQPSSDGPATTSPVTAPAPTAASDEADRTWLAVERIDAKMANAIVFMTVRVRLNVAMAP